jgi:small subunit ribosomal protein S10
MSDQSQKIKIRLRSYDHTVLDASVSEIVDKAQRAGAKVSGPIPLPRKIHKFTVLRSPHIDKKARDQFEMRIYNRLIEVECTPEALQALMGLTLASEVEVEIKV